MLDLIEPRAAAVDELHAATAIYTTAHVVDQLLDRVAWGPRTRARLLDPSAGDGAFLERALERLRPDPDNHGALKRIKGLEIHPGAVIAARRRLSACLERLGWPSILAGKATIGMVTEGDFLVGSAPRGPFHIIAGNPPYLRFGRLPDHFKTLYGRAVAEHARGDILWAFLDRCCKVLAEDGVICAVTADRWLFNESAAALREAIGARLGLEFVARLDAETSFYRPKHRRAGAPPRIHPVEVVLRAGATPITRAPISPDGALAGAAGQTLGDVATVRIAPWLGPAGIFVVDETIARRLIGAALTPAVDTDDIDAATDTLRPPRRYAIRTDRDREPVGAVAAHLRAQAERMPQRGRNRPFWVPPESITLPLDQPALLVPRIARRLRAILLPPGVLPINHNLTVVAAGDMPLVQLRALLLSPGSQAWISANAPRLENDYLSISTRLLRRLPVKELKHG